MYYHGKCTDTYDKIKRLQGKYDIFEVSMTDIDKKYDKVKARMAITTQDGHFKGKYDEDKLKYCTVMVSMKKNNNQRDEIH